MHAKVVLFDLENNKPTAKLLKDIIEHYSTLYLFNCIGHFEYALEDLTEFASWVSSGQVIILETPKAEHKEFEYAVVVGQLMALLEPHTQVEVISTVQSIETLMLMLKESKISSHLIYIDAISQKPPSHFKIPSIEKILQSTELQNVKKYCNALAKMTGKPNTLEKLKNSVTNILQLNAQQTQNIVGMLINLKIVKKYEGQIEFRKKILKQWVQINLNQKDETIIECNIIPIHKQLNLNNKENKSETVGIENPQNLLFKNFAHIDPVQIEVAKKLRELKNKKPKDIYALRDLLEQMFPMADVRLLLKELIEKGYIYWNGHEVLYSHEMFLS